ncbi:MAG: hypothetical protein JW959_07180 [Pirellulales bacterium]|nr:hypothetical protein [Pirellulales bacterium]
METNDGLLHRLERRRRVVEKFVVLFPWQEAHRTSAPACVAVRLLPAR